MSEDDFTQLQFTERGPAPVGRPWPRLFARMLDTFLFAFVGSIILGIVLVIATRDGADRYVAMTNGVGGMLISNVLGYALALLPIAFFIAFVQTPGKWLFGIRVRNRDGSRLGFVKALKREGWVIVRGVGFGVPLLILIALATSYSHLKDEGRTRWDEVLDCDVQHAPATWFWWIRATFGALLCIAMNFWGYFSLLKSMATG